LERRGAERVLGGAFRGRPAGWRAAPGGSRRVLGCGPGWWWFRVVRVPASPDRRGDGGQTPTRTLRWRGAGCSRSGVAGGSLVRAAQGCRVAREGPEPAWRGL